MIYLDAAATTFQKPPEVGGAAERALRTMTTPGRGSGGGSGGGNGVPLPQ